MILENNAFVLGAECFRYIQAFILGEYNTPETFIYGEVVVEIAGVCDVLLRAMVYQSIWNRILPCTSISMGLPKQDQARPYGECI